MKISNGVYNCLVNQAILMKHDSNQTGIEIANKIVEEYFQDDELNDDELNIDEKNEFISKISYILRD